MIDRQIKRCLGQMSKGVQVVGSEHNGIHRLYTSHWVSQVAFEEPIVMASVSPKHETYSLIVASGRFTVSILAGDQIAEGQYFSYPGHKFKYALTEFVEVREDLPYVPNSIAWLTCEVFKQTSMRDHELFFCRSHRCSRRAIERRPTGVFFIAGLAGSFNSCSPKKCLGTRSTT